MFCLQKIVVFNVCKEIGLAAAVCATGVVGATGVVVATASICAYGAVGATILL